MPRNRSEADPAAHLPETTRVYVHMVARKNTLTLGSIDREEAVDELINYWEREVNEQDQKAYRSLNHADRIGMVMRIKLLMEEGKLT